MRKKEIEATLIYELQTCGESELVEVKKENTEPEIVPETNVATPNSVRSNETGSSYILWCSEDFTFNMVCPNFYPGKTKFHNQEVSSWITRHLRPSIRINFEDDKHIIVLNVPAAKEELTATAKPNKPPRAYVRLGSSNVPLEDHKEHNRKLWASY